MRSSERKARHKARQAICQALYQWHFNPTTEAGLVAQFLEDPIYERMDRDYFTDKLQGVLSSLNELDALLEPVVDRDLSRLTPMEWAVLRLAVYELQAALDIPFRVVIKEAIALTQAYGATDASKFVNGVLDRLVADLRPGEK